MANPGFRFKKFMIMHDQCAMKVGTDGVLLGAWVDVPATGAILDVGTGSGLIAIMCAQRTEAAVHGIEIDEKAYRQAEDNKNKCPWKNRISIWHDSLQHFTAVTTLQFDLIVSNPPYFRKSLKSPLKERTWARHDDKLDYESLLFYSSQLLRPDGRLAIILPAAESDRFKELAWLYCLHPLRMTLVRDCAGKEFSRCLAEYSRNGNSHCQVNELNIKTAELLRTHYGIQGFNR